jgi:hypothetical protein
VVYLSNFNVNDQVDNPELSLSRGEPIAPTVGMAELANPIFMLYFLFVADSPASVPSRAMRSAFFEQREKSTPLPLPSNLLSLRAFIFVVPTTAEVVTTNWYYEFLC